MQGNCEYKPGYEGASFLTKFPAYSREGDRTLDSSKSVKVSLIRNIKALLNISASSLWALPWSHLKERFAPPNESNLEY